MEPQELSVNFSRFLVHIFMYKWRRLCKNPACGFGKLLKTTNKRIPVLAPLPRTYENPREPSGASTCAAAVLRSAEVEMKQTLDLNLDLF